jgi:hypothetical protein
MSTPAEKTLRDAIGAAAGQPVPAVHTADALVDELDHRQWLSCPRTSTCAPSCERRSRGWPTYPVHRHRHDRFAPPSVPRPASIDILLTLAVRQGGRALKRRAVTPPSTRSPPS